MINIKMRLEKAPVVRGESMYCAVASLDGSKCDLCRIRARGAKQAEEKLMVCLKAGLSGKTVDFDLEAYRKEKGE